MSIITGRRLNYFYQKAVKPLVDKIENALLIGEMDDHIFNALESGFAPKTSYDYGDSESRFLRADGEWENPSNNNTIANRYKYSIDGTDGAYTDTFLIRSDGQIPYGGILILSVYQVKNVGSYIGVHVLLASYAYSISVGSVVSGSDIYSGVKIAALSGALSSTYGTITAVNGSSTDSRAKIQIAVKSGYYIWAKTIS